MGLKANWWDTGSLTAAVLGSSSDARSRTRALAVSAAAALALTWLRDGKPAVVPAAIFLPMHLAGATAASFTVGMGVSPMLMGAGVLVGPRIGGSVLAG